MLTCLDDTWQGWLVIAHHDLISGKKGCALILKYSGHVLIHLPALTFLFARSDSLTLSDSL